MSGVEISPHTPRFAAIGEVLWDRFLDAERLGGAPANAAVHAAGVGADAVMISRVGDDPAGLETARLLSERGVDVSHLQVDGERPTGAAVVTLDASGEPAFEIVENAAWDAVEWTEGLGELASRVDAVTFGTLGQRCEPSRSTIQMFVDACSPGSIRCLDLNLRQRFYSTEIVEESLRLANCLKLNRDELSVLARILDVDDETPRVVETLREAFSLRWVAVTLGAEGCRIWDEGEIAVPGTVVDVRDTVGAGDAFTAALLVHLLSGADMTEAATAACRLGAYVASCEGATPHVPPEYRLT